MTDLFDLIRQSSDYSEGKTDADRDFAAGKLAQRDYGPSPSWWEVVTKYLLERYRITFEAVDISADHALIARSIRYNERMREHISAKFGQDVIGDAYSKAEEQGVEYFNK